MEAYASNYYLSTASWCDSKGLEGCAGFLCRIIPMKKITHDEIVYYIIDAGGRACTRISGKLHSKFKKLKDV
ncbi:MAG: hypothetical protein IPL12_21565 [Bacteroidetes bacterium]|nr:hypothetical protein [Bacteroidota bacterium]